MTGVRAGLKRYTTRRHLLAARCGRANTRDMEQPQMIRTYTMVVRKSKHAATSLTLMEGRE
jgi:hypothetical protein